MLARVIRLAGSLAQHERALLVGLIVIFGSAWALIEITEEVVLGETAVLDRRLILALRNPVDHSDPIGPAWIEEMARDATALGGILFIGLATLVATIYFLSRRFLSQAAYLLVAVLGGLLFSTLFKSLIDRERPDLVVHGSHVYSASFPSGHSLMATTIYLTIAVILMQSERNWMLRIFFFTVALLLSVLTGVSRVYLGVHWPTDVLAGITAGVFWALLCYLVNARFRAWYHRRNRAEPNTVVASSAEEPPRDLR